MLPVKQICIDSRQSASDTQNSSNFKIELGRSYKLPPDTVYFITDVCIPHAWMTVETGSNDNIYFMASDDSCVSYSYYIGTVPLGVYAGAGFAKALDSAMYVSYLGVSVLYTSNMNKLDITITGLATRLIKILADKETIS